MWYTPIYFPPWWQETADDTLDATLSEIDSPKAGQLFGLVNPGLQAKQRIFMP
jgi:hypothetical protein